MIRNHLQGCFLLLSWGHIAFRPLVPPTQTLDEFREADQRLYMSATLGAGGELERISGVRQIDRLPAPPSWENQASGRRLFLFPDASIKPKERDELIIQAVKAADRGLVLAPTRIHAGRRRDQFEAERLTVLGPRDIEESLVPFVEADEAALVLANRYDGLDLPEDASRLLIIDGVPAGTNLLEHFLQSRLALISLIRERMRTRFVQGVGRC